MKQRLRQQWWVLLNIPSSAAIRIEYLMVLLFRLIAQGQRTVARLAARGHHRHPQ
jgi:hypothetical protein